MSARISLDDLSDDQKKLIRKHLFFQPKTPFRRKKNYYNSHAKDPILFYYIDKPKNEIVLPYTFANSLIGKHINSCKEYTPVKYNFKGTLRDHQKPVFETCIQHLKSKGTTILGAYPGFGKTILSACMASQLGGLALVLFPLKILLDGWKNTFSDFITAKIWINDEKTKDEFDIQKHQVILSMDTQFHKLNQNILSQVQILIIDECHMFCTPKRIHCLLGTSPKYIVGCTATLERNDGMETIIHALCGTDGVFLKNPKSFNVYKISTNVSVVPEFNKRGETVWPDLVKKICEHEKRNNMILKIVKDNLDFKFIILTWNRKHAYYLKDLFISNDISADLLVGNKKSYNDSKVLVGTAQKIGTGFDEKLSCPDWSGVRSNVLMLVGSTKSLSGLHQFCGRVYRSDYPIIVDFVDNMGICRRHWYLRKKYYLDPETNGVVHEINYSDKEEINLNKIDEAKPQEIDDIQNILYENILIDKMINNK